ncbi:hypothetical protein V7S43_013622 [Phytophthora oleae]|uniref:Uncharacterized protein n=1 Tax=Phytophthora oleae TaxID=2107226 RepID=A0ABD3F7E4_9STRA
MEWPPANWDETLDPPHLLLFENLNATRPELWIFEVLEVRVPPGADHPFDEDNRPAPADTTHARCLECHRSFLIRHTAARMECSEFLRHTEVTHRRDVLEFMAAARGRPDARARIRAFRLNPVARRPRPDAPTRVSRPAVVEALRQLSAFAAQNLNVHEAAHARAVQLNALIEALAAAVAADL